jgi:hypothetical protein
MSTSSSRSNFVGQHPRQQYFAPSVNAAAAAAASAPRGLSPVGGILMGRTSPSTARAYEESSIEILKSDSKEDSNSVSPLPIIADRA